MTQNQYHLLKTRRFLPLFITQFCNALNDNVFKNSFVILITFQMTQIIFNEQILIALIGGVFILPFFLFSATAGQVADKYEKTFLIWIIKATEIVFMIIGSIGFYLHNLILLMMTLFFLGTHSTFFGPIKYSILPNVLSKDELIGGNAFIEAGTFVAILVGQILGGSLILMPNGTLAITSVLLIIAVFGFVASLFIPIVGRAAPNLSISFNLVKVTARLIKLTTRQKEIYISIIGISWFWFVGATLITQFPTFTKEYLRGSAPIFTLFLTVFSLGIGMGSLMCNKFLKGKITPIYVPTAMLFMSIFIADIYFAASKPLVESLPLLSLQQFVSSLNNLRILLDVFLMTFCGGFFVVPLYALIQVKSEESSRSRVISVINIMSALFMVGSAVFVMLGTTLEYSIPQLLIMIAMGNLFMGLYMRKLKKHF